MKKVLFIPFMATYDKSKGAGCKNENYYIKQIAADHDIDFRLLTFEDFDDEYDALMEDLQKYHICNDVCVRDRHVWSKIIRGVKNIPSRYFPLDKYGNFTSKYYLENIQKYLKKYKKEGYNPDVIILGWTQVILFVEEIKRIFPFAKYIALEEDVSYLGIFRKRNREASRIRRIVLQNQYNRLKKAELEALSKYDLVFTNNPKDMKLLQSDGLKIKGLSWIAPWYNQFPQGTERNIDWNNPFIIYYGAMGRPENSLSAEWFINNVLPLIDQKIKFVIIGSGAENIRHLASERVIVTGFVEDVSVYFSRCICMAASLVLGAGIKIKVLEAMSAGIPVLTNSIGIEGIVAEDNRDFFLCEKPEDYIEAIDRIINGDVDLNLISQNARKIIFENYDFHKSSLKLLESVKCL